MPLGPGKYDPECTRVMQDQQADAVLLIVVNGKKGNGFSLQSIPEWVLKVPELLRDVANDIEQSVPKT